MTDISELVQYQKLLIANGYETAKLLRHLAENEIDSDYFAVTSECESYGTEVDAELSITEFALRASGYVDGVTAELEKAQARIAELEADKESERREWMARGVESWLNSRNGRWNGTTKEAQEYAAVIRNGEVDL